VATQLFKKVLVPTDGTAKSVKAGRLGFRIARAQGASVTILFVLDPRVTSKRSQASNSSAAQIREAMTAEGKSYLAHLEEVAAEQNLTVRRELREGTPYQEILALAEEMGADLIVMGHSEQRGPRRTMRGSVAEKVIRFASCPVLVVSERAVI
jgi:nucleotide-binding universal stress UspA family protein